MELNIVVNMNINYEKVQQINNEYGQYILSCIKRSTYRGEFVWEYNHGNLREMYSAFRDRGISLKMIFMVK